ncbi:uncharacterized protein TNCV_4213191 [Trichonephila clavipes]|nr:uncharacterized protein TNCV_4213191 [Trichonephila clavipes]
MTTPVLNAFSFGGYNPYGLASILTGLESNRACVGYAWPTNCSPSTPSQLFTEIRRALLDEWCNIPQDQIDNLILTACLGVLELPPIVVVVVSFPKGRKERDNSLCRSISHTKILTVTEGRKVARASDSLTRGLVARRLFKVSPCREGTKHLQISMSSPGFEPKPNDTEASVTNE